MTAITRIVLRSPTLFSLMQRDWPKNKSSYVTKVVLQLGFEDAIFRGEGGGGEMTAGNTSNPALEKVFLKRWPDSNRSQRNEHFQGYL